MKKTLKLKRELAVVRETLRDLRPPQLKQVNGGANLPTCIPFITCIDWP